MATYHKSLSHGGDSGYRVCDWLTEHDRITSLFHSCMSNKFGRTLLGEREKRLLKAKAAKQELMRRNLTRFIHDTDLIRYPIDTWPAWVKTLTFKEHKDRNERYNLLIWLWRNGVVEHIAEKIVMYHGNYEGYRYDRAAIQQMADLVKGLSRPGSKIYEAAHAKPVFVMELERVDPPKRRDQY